MRIANCVTELAETGGETLISAAGTRFGRGAHAHFVTFVILVIIS
jgi:hypothetical protein